MNNNKYIIIIFFLLFKPIYGYTQIVLNNPIEITISPSGKYLVSSFSLDTVGYDDSIKPIYLDVYDLETNSKVVHLEKILADVDDLDLIKWVNDDVFFINTPKIYSLSFKSFLNRRIPNPASVISFSKSLNELLYLEYDFNTYSFSLMERNYGDRISDFEIAPFNRMFEASDAVPPYELSYEKINDQIGLIGYQDAVYSLYSYNFSNQNLREIANYKPSKKWDTIKFVLIDTTGYVLNKRSKELILLSDSLYVIAKDVDDVVLANNKLIFKRGDELFCFKNEAYEEQRIVQDAHLIGKELIFSDGTRFVFKEAEGKNYLDPINYGTDYIIKVYRYHLNELGDK